MEERDSTDRRRHDPGGRYWSVGATLREAREAGSESILDISAATRIRPEYLYALEDEDYHQLPGWAYAISFVRTYAEYLGLDARPLVLHVKEQLALREHVMGPIYAQDVVYARRSGRPWLLVLGLLVLIGAGAAYAASPPGTLARLFEPVPTRLRALIDRSFFAVAEDGNPTERAGLSLAGAPATIAAPPPAAQGEVERGPRFAPLRDTKEHPEQVLLVTHPAGAVDRDAPVLPEITLRARDVTMVTVEDAAGAVLLAERLEQGALFRLPKEAGLNISADDGGAVEVYLNGELAGVLASPGAAVERFPVTRLTGGTSGGS